MRTILACTDLTKRYGKHDAVRNLEMKLNDNTIYGLLGRNGAGKTTLLNMITGSLFPSYGQIEVAGSRLKRGDTPKDVCYIREKNLFFGSAKVIEILQFASVFHRNWDWRFAHELLRMFNLNPNKKIRQLSRGMESLVGNIIGLASRAKLTIYDEPVLGLDVLMRERFYRILVEDYAAHPRTIVCSTHLIDEIATVIEQVYIMDAGSILMHDEVDNIRNQSHLLSGDHESVKSFSYGRKVIYREAYGNNDLAAVYGTLGDTDRQLAHHLGITIESLPLQKFFSYLIEGGQRNE
ncbi:ABC transporter ATP-binding protein [Paenibacillus sp. CCS19]|uniref:ATP-binding cassette domain-containing protein n=1 Tax=Paenibacillus sp. CCS19 TaxID=3158387 RepID=UPI00255D6580|nr:ABC transporter ATP-binding protein [Paenibacillus cellulosilyticus]GMK38495.1 ABC transporter ATP-binding protein [Paenibacillus cellulosilyticus]